MFFSSGRRETPFLDARLRAQKYSPNFNAMDVTTASQLSSSSSTTTVRSTTAAQKLFESGEDLNADVLDDDDEISDDEDDDEDVEDEMEEDGDDESDVKDDFLVGKSFFPKACCMETMSVQSLYSCLLIVGFIRR